MKKLVLLPVLAIVALALSASSALAVHTWTSEGNDITEPVLVVSFGGEVRLTTANLAITCKSVDDHSTLYPAGEGPVSNVVEPGSAVDLNLVEFLECGEPECPVKNVHLVAWTFLFLAAPGVIGDAYIPEQYFQERFVEGNERAVPWFFTIEPEGCGSNRPVIGTGVVAGVVAGNKQIFNTENFSIGGEEVLRIEAETTTEGELGEVIGVK